MDMTTNKTALIDIINETKEKANSPKFLEVKMAQPNNIGTIGTTLKPAPDSAKKGTKLNHSKKPIYSKRLSKKVNITNRLVIQGKSSLQLRRGNSWIAPTRKPLQRRFTVGLLQTIF